LVPIPDQTVRILIVSNLYPPEIQGGYEILCAQVVNWLRARNHVVVVLTSTGGSENSSELRLLRLTNPFPAPARRGRLHLRKLQQFNQSATAGAIAQVGPELIFMWSQLRLGSGPARAAEASGIPVVYTWNDDHVLGLAPVPWGLEPRRMIGALSDRTWARAATWSGLKFRRALTISQKLREILQRGGYPGDLKVLYQGIRLEDFACKENMGSVGSPGRLLYVGQLHDYKGVHTLLEALPHCPDWNLTIVGTGNPVYVERLKQLALPLGERVCFLGRLPHSQLSQIYQEHDAFVFPSLWDEPYGLTHLEAMASGLPLVATLHGGHGEHLRDGINCLGFHKGSAEELARALQRIQSDPALARRLAQQGRELVVQELNFERYAQELEELLWCALTP
jgi:glycogen(starch) synthase